MIESSLKNKACKQVKMIYSSVEAIDEKIKRSIPTGLLICDLSERTAFFESKTPVCIEKIASITITEEEVNIVTREKEEYTFKII